MNKFNNPKIKRTDVEILETKEFTSDFWEGYGSDYYEITEEHIEILKKGKVLGFNVQGEYGLYIKLRGKT